MGNLESMKLLSTLLFAVLLCHISCLNVRSEENYTTTTAAEEAGLSQKNLTDILLTDGNLSAYEPSAVVRGAHKLINTHSTPLCMCQSFSTVLDLVRFP